MAFLLGSHLLCIFMAALSLLLLQYVAARELAETVPAVTSSAGKQDGVSVGNVDWRRYSSRRGREAYEVRGLCEYVPPISYCCHIIDDVPMCFYSKHDCQLNCVKEIPPANH